MTASNKVIRKISLRKLFAGVKRFPELLRCSYLFKNWVELASVYAGIRSVGDGFKAIGRNGFAIPIHEAADAQTVWVVFCGSDYHIPSKCETALDLGANIGAFCIYAAVAAGVNRVWAYEPVPETFNRLQTVVTTNGYAERIRCVNEGVAGSSGLRQIWIGSATPHSSMFYRGNPEFESGHSLIIRTSSLRDILASLGVAEIDVVKMDCEGAEVEAVLQADTCTMRRMRNVSMEYHFPNAISTVEKLLDKWRSSGFRVVRHRPHERLLWLERVGS